MPNIGTNTLNIINYISRNSPNAVAEITGSPMFPEIQGTVSMYQTASGVLVASEIFGLPYSLQSCNDGVFGMHIHEGGSCTVENINNLFASSGMHYNPGNCPHPYHAGDLPPLFANNGYAWNIVLTARFTVREVTGRTVIIHRNPDDFTSQPSGNSGEKIACGVLLQF